MHLIQTLGSESDSPSREIARAILDNSRTYMGKHAQGAAPVAGGQARSMAMRLVPAFQPVMILRRDRFLRGGDHTSFNLEGFPAVRITEWQENFNHQHQTPRVEGGIEIADDIKFVDFNYVAQVARMNAATLATFASAPGIPRNVHVTTTNLDNNTELSWEAPAGMPAGAYYEILSRPTDQTDWTAVEPVHATKVTLAVSKDNTIFGIRTVDAAGHRSYAVYPMPSRAIRNAPGVPPVTVVK